MTQYREGPVSPAAPRRRLLGQTLVERGLLGATDLRQWLAAQSALPPDRPVRRLGSLLVEAGILELQQLSEVLGGLRHVRAASCTMDHVEPQLRGLFPLEALRRIEAVPLFRAGHAVAVAMADPHNADQVAELERLCGHPIEPMQAPQLYIQTLLRDFQSRDFQTIQGSATSDRSASRGAEANAPWPEPEEPDEPIEPDVRPARVAPVLQPDEEGPGFHLQVRPARVDRVPAAPRRGLPPPAPGSRPARDVHARRLDGGDAVRRAPRDAGPRLGTTLLIALLFQLTGIGMGFWMGTHHRPSPAPQALSGAVAAPVRPEGPAADGGPEDPAVVQAGAELSAAPALAAPAEHAPAASLQPASPEPGPPRGLPGSRRRAARTRLPRE